MMSALQVRDFPEDLHRRLRRIAFDSGIPITTLVTALLARSLGVPHAADRDVRDAIRDWKGVRT